MAKSRDVSVRVTAPSSGRGSSPKATPVTIDRRSALKTRHRAAILRAARELVDERGDPKFSVDELAERADIARRTIFNHFASLDEVLLALCADALEVIVDDFVEAITASPVGDDSRASMFDELAGVLESADLPTAISSIARILGEPDANDSRGRALSDEAFARAAERLLVEVTRRHPEADPIDVELLVSSLMGGVIVIAKRWMHQTSGSLEAPAREAWQQLLARLTDSVRSGYQPDPPESSRL
jgi:TetR/AcrR family transcriptional regulator of autoinduction and epiphytic fitness